MMGADAGRARRVRRALRRSPRPLRRRSNRITRERARQPHDPLSERIGPRHYGHDPHHDYEPRGKRAVRRVSDGRAWPAVGGVRRRRRRHQHRRELSRAVYPDSPAVVVRRAGAQVKARASEAPTASVARANVATAPLTDEAPRVQGEPPAASLSRANADPEKRSEPAITEPEAARPSPEAKLAVITSSYWIQVGAFRTPDAAGELAARLLEQDLPVAIDSVALTSNHRGLVLSRVRVGPFANRAELVPKLQLLQKGGYRPFVAREPD